MTVENIKIRLDINWHRLRNRLGGSYKWGDAKGLSIDDNWRRGSVIYRWVKYSNSQVAHLGETGRELRSRVGNHLSASKQSGTTNKKLYAEAEQLRQSKNGDHLYLEFTDSVPGYNLNNKAERIYAEALLTGYYRPYLMRASYRPKMP